MNNKLINELSNLELNYKYLTRCLDLTYDKNKRIDLYDKIRETKAKIIKTKSKIKLERLLRNDKNR